MKKSALLVICSLQLLPLNHCFSQTGKPQYKVTDKIHLDGDGGWDYLTADESGGRLFVSHSNIVQVVDLKTKKVIQTISDLNGVHGIALAPDLNKGYISNGRDSSVTVFDYKNLSTKGKVQVTGSNPDAILYDTFTKRVFTFNGRSHNATVIDAATDKVINTIPLDGKPEFAVSDGKGKIYLNIEDKSMIAVINSKDMKVEKQWSIAPGNEPSGLAIDEKNHRLFSVCDNKLMVILDYENGKVISTLPIGDGVDGAVYDPELKRAYASNGDGTLTVVQEEDASTFKVIANVPTQKGARTIAVDTKTHHLYLQTADREATTDEHKRPAVKPGTFVVLEVAETNK